MTKNKMDAVFSLCLAILMFAGMSFKTLAGTDGKVEFDKDVYEVGKTGAVTVKEPTGYDYKAKKDFGKVKTDISGEGTFKVTAEKSPSKKVNDSGTAVTFTPTDPNIGEEELTYMDTCTVVRVLIDDADVYGFVLPDSTPFVIVWVAGRAQPLGLGQVITTATPASGIWTPSVGTATGWPVNFLTVTTMDGMSGMNPINIKFDIKATYSVAQASVSRISHHLPWPWWP